MVDGRATRWVWECSECGEGRDEIRRRHIARSEMRYHKMTECTGKRHGDCEKERDA